MVEKSDIGVHELMSELQVAPWFGGDLISFLPRDVPPAASWGQTIILSLGDAAPLALGHLGVKYTYGMYSSKIYRLRST